MANNASQISDINPDGLSQQSPVIAYTEKIIEQEKLQLKKYIEDNYSKIRDVEREFANLNLELKLTAGSKNAAFEHLRKKIELQNEKIHLAEVKEEQAKKAWEDALKVVQDEESVKQKLCEDVNQLVQESNNSQIARLVELKRRLEALNPGRSSTSMLPNSLPTSASPAVSTMPVVNEVTSNTSSKEIGEKVATNDQNQLPKVDGEGRGKKKRLILGRGKNLESGWTGAGFDVDTGS